MIRLSSCIEPLLDCTFSIELSEFIFMVQTFRIYIISLCMFAFINIVIRDETSHSIGDKVK